MRGELRLSLFRPLIIYGVFWILIVMFLNQWGLLSALTGIEIPPIAFPQISQESPKVITQDFLKIAGCVNADVPGSQCFDGKQISFYVWAGTIEQNVSILIDVDGRTITSFPLPPNYEYVKQVAFRLDSGSHTIEVKKIKDANVLDSITWTVVIP